MNLRPQDFWNLSVDEWRWLNEAGARDAPSRAEIDALVAQYPDERKGAAFPPPLAGEVSAK
ncbi:MAG: phage tail assembly chaperone, partial [Amphiplicatus sp.]